MMTATKKSPTVSVVIPAKNEAANIARVLNSVRVQDYPVNKIDVLVIDNLSTDNTVEIARSFDRVSVHSNAGTIAEMRNLGISKTNGDIVAFIDSDCIAPSNWISQSVDDLQTNNSAAIVSAVMKLEDGVKAPWVERYWVYQLSNNYTEKLNQMESISSFCFCAHRKDLNKVGGFDAALATCEDADLGYRIKNSGRDILADTRIQTVHLGNAKSLWKFFLRQLWQGSSNLKNTKNRRLELSELPSLILPAVFMLFLLSSAILALMSVPVFSLIALVGAAGLAAVITIKKNISRSVVDFLAYMVIWSTYLCARGLGYFISIGRTSR